MSTLVQAKYVEDVIADFETNKAILPQTVRNDVQDRGGTMIFLVSSTGGRTAVTRGIRGLIPPADNVQSQVTLTFEEAHDKVILTNFNIFRSHGNQVDLMRNQTLMVIRREQDIKIIEALATATISAGTLTGTIDDILKISTTLANKHVGINAPGNLFGVVTPAVFNTLLKIPQFSNADYTSIKKVDDGLVPMGDRRYWLGIDWMAHPDLTGAGTATSTNFVYHRDAVGYATSTQGIDAYLGYNQEEDYTIRRASLYHGSTKLIDAGIIKFTFNDTALAI